MDSALPPVQNRGARRERKEGQRCFQQETTGRKRYPLLRTGKGGQQMTGTIFERYGGFATVSRIVSGFYDRVLDSDVLSPYFVKVDMRNLIDHQTKFIATLMGGPASYTNEHLARVHRRLNITETAFEEAATILRETLEDFEMDGSDVTVVMREFVSRRPYIVFDG